MQVWTIIMMSMTMLVMIMIMMMTVLMMFMCVVMEDDLYKRLMEVNSSVDSTTCLTTMLCVMSVLEPYHFASGP